MEKEKIDLSKIKVAIFDFDDTLAIHEDKDFLKHRDESEENYFNYYTNAYKYPKEFYESIEPCFRSEKTYSLIQILRSKGVKMYCLSGMRFSFHIAAKKHFISKNYGDDIEFLSAASQELKVDGVKAIQKINNCKLNEILFIDDMPENIVRLKEIGVKAILANDIDILLK